ncbi:MAG: efflux RND transporter permease subunit, partial [Proteobacteria bacterium]|nr:efflux RND transporter permease subunit [Pseudomonadota bacterium]
VSDVVLEFAWDGEMSEAVQDALAKIDLLRLPEDAERPLILRFDPSLDPVMELSLSSARSDATGEPELRRLRRIGELQVRRALEPVKGVAAVRVRGGLEEEIHILLDSGKLQRTGLATSDIVDRLRQENINLAGGTLKEGRTDYLVRTINEYRSLEQIADTLLQWVDGREIRVRDVGQVLLAHKERELITRTDGTESVQIDIFKEADANMVALSERIHDALGSPDARPRIQLPGQRSPGAGRRGGFRGGRAGAAMTAGLAAHLKQREDVLIRVVVDRSVFTESAIREVRNTAAVGGLLAVVILFVFLRSFKSTLIVAVSIPVSIAMTFAPLGLSGVSLNIMSLGGLALGIGMLVDSSIVVLESIHRCRQEGDATVAATVRGTNEVRGAVAASIFTTIGVFLPMVFVEGVAGQAFADLGLAVVTALSASLLVSLFLIPMLASREPLSQRAPGSHALRFRELHSWRALRSDVAGLDGPRRLALAPYLVLRLAVGAVLELAAKLLGAVLFALVWVCMGVVVAGLGRALGSLLRLPIKAADAALAAMARLYPRILNWSLRNPALILALTGLCMLATYEGAMALESELLPEVHQGEFSVELALPVGTPLEENDAVLRPLEQAILAEQSLIERLSVTLGYDAANSQRSDEGEHTARFKFLLRPTGDNARTEAEVIRRLRARFAEIPDLKARVVRPVLFSFRTPVEVQIYGDDLAMLKRAAYGARDAMRTMPELADVKSTLQSGAPEVQIVYNRDQLMRYGLAISEVANLVRDEVKGRMATRYNLRDRRVPIVVRLAEQDRSSVGDIRELVVNRGHERPVRLGAVAKVELGEGPSEVRRIDGHRAAVVRASIGSGSLGSAVRALQVRLQGALQWPDDVSFEISGHNKEWERSRSSLLLALCLSIFLVYVIMAAQFESLLYPLIILFTIPLAFVGTVLALHAFKINLSVVVFLGMIMLAGIVVNNAIVLVDYTNRLRRRGTELGLAVVTAGGVRLRPILMTSATTVLGLLPMAVGLGDGAEIRTPLAIAVISGLVSSTVLTLIVIPTLYFLVDRAIARIFPARAHAGAPAQFEGGGV